MADDLDRGMPPRGAARVESDPLAELARLIGQNDPFAGSGRPAGPKVQPRPAMPEPVRPPEGGAADPLAAAGPPPWVQRSGGRPEAPRPQQVPQEENLQGAVHPVHRYGNANAASQHEFQEEAFAEDEDQPDSARYDDTLFGQVDDGAREYRRDQGYSDDPYAFEEDGYDEGEDEGQGKRGGGLGKILMMVLVLAVIGTGGAFAYRAFVSSPRNGEPPIIRADNSPTKIVPGPAEGSAKVPDRLSAGGSEKMVSREETPVDVNNTRSVGPRVVFPPLNQSANAAAPATNMASNDPPLPVTAPSNLVPNNNVALGNGEPRRIKTFSVHGDQADGTAAATPAAPPPPKPAKGKKSPASANASADAPMSLTPQGSPAPAAETRMANSAPSTDSSAAPAGAGYLVQVSSQPSEALAQASYKALQTKFSDVLGQYTPVIQRADLADKTVYRAMVGPFGSSAEAVQVCASLKTAGGQCFVPKK